MDRVKIDFGLRFLVFSLICIRCLVSYKEEGCKEWSCIEIISCFGEMDWGGEVKMAVVVGKDDENGDIIVVDLEVNKKEIMVNGGGW